MESKDTGSELPPRRRDADSDWHDLSPMSCADCGCTHFVARDDPEVIWEPGAAWEETCSDRSCHCHLDPVIGTRRV